MTYLHNGHKIDIVVTLAGISAFLDDDLEPQDITGEELKEIQTNGVLI